MPDEVICPRPYICQRKGVVTTSENTCSNIFVSNKIVESYIALDPVNVRILLEHVKTFPLLALIGGIRFRDLH